MTGWIARHHGEPTEVLELTGHLSVPLAPGTAVVQVHACGLNFADGLVCRGTYQEDPGLPFTPGIEIAGVVETVDDPTGRIEPGSAVVGTALLPHGGLATRCAARTDDLHLLDDPSDVVFAAATHITYQTAWISLVHRAALDPGETVLVRAGAGGTGGACVSIAAALGARVIATAGGSAKLDECRRLGAEAVIDHRSQDVVAQVRELTDGRGADVIIDPVGGDDFALVRRCAAFEARIVVLGFASGAVPAIPANHVMVRNLSVLGVQWPAYRSERPELVAQAQRDLLAWSAAGRLVTPSIQRRPLADAPAALEALLGGHTTGKVVIEPQSAPVGEEIETGAPPSAADR